ncbi:hypothetical protein [Legionella rowbothamii]|uniref:hypothetical protein n=1 Tax=Legionella rowbothamii TaxID=96229 RepID=UPI001054DD4D|nr:hypothetical protein [Legionella rowbothamii]
MSGTKLLGNLYSDERDEAQLDPVAQERFNGYLEQLAALDRYVHSQDNDNVNFSAWQEWENGLRQIYKDMVFDAFNASNIKIPPKMEIHFAGSLAKAQATQYSDLDAFVIVEKEEDIELVKPVFDALNNLCQRMFTTTNQLYPDPIGINPSRLIGTPESLYEQLQNGAVVDAEATVRSLVSSKPIFPRYELGEQLCDKIRNDSELGGYCSAKKLYNLAIHDFKAPSQNASHVSVKTHIMRPLDFILMGMRTEFGLYREDGGHLSGLGTLSLLRENKLLPENDIDRIAALCNKAMAKRFELHADHRSEHDEMPYDEAQEMLAEVEWLRGVAIQRVQRLDAPRPVATPSPEKTPGFFARNAGVFKGMALTTTAFVAVAAISLGLGLIGGGIMAPLVAAGGVVAGVAVVPAVLLAVGALLAAAVAGYSLYKGIQAISNWFSAKNNVAPETVIASRTENAPSSYTGPMAQLTNTNTVSKQKADANLEDNIGYGNPLGTMNTTSEISQVEEPQLRDDQLVISAY